MNAYDNNQYIKWRRTCDELFFSKCNFDKIEDVKKLDDGYYINTYTVKGKFDIYDNTKECEGYIDRLYNDKDELIYEWKSPYHKSRVSNIIHHSNNKNYLVFTENLYGYSVLELDTLKSVHYIPEISSFYRNENCEETFIWCDFHYNNKNNYLAIEGCIWAAPYSVIVIDFSNPLEIQEEFKWVDIHNIIDSNFQKYLDIDFERWDENNLLCVAENYHTKKSENITISIDKSNDYRWYKKIDWKKILICLGGLLLVLFCIFALFFLSATVKDYILLNGYFDKDEYFDSNGFQDYTDYCKYYYKNDKKFINNYFYKKVTNKDIENIISYFENFENRMKVENRLDVYDFDINAVSEGDYVRIKTKEGKKIGNGKYSKFDNYTIYFYDIQSNTLYYIHSNS